VKPFEISLADWLAGFDPDEPEPVCDVCLDNDAEQVEDIDGVPFHLCEYCQRDI
jgi:hypothetical protein